MAANPSGQGFQNKNRVAILAELDKEKRKLLMQNQSSTNHPGASIALSRPSLNKDFRDHAEQQHIAAQQKAALQVSQVGPTFPSHWRIPGSWKPAQFLFHISVGQYQ
uniref:SOSS complex subunit C n=1 Tax=Ailuropoda melanoleuca TaxID=9646 RepID=A0A7N5KPS7_AILME